MNRKGATDQEKLAKFLSSCKDYNLWESDRLHQKKITEGIGKWPDGYEGGNIKIVIGFNTEFILNGKGRFKNIIDPEGASENGVVNGASFNYANKNDYDSKNKSDPKSVHGRLDVNIGKVDPEWRKKVIGKDEEKYRPPNKEQFKNPSNTIYSTNGKSVEEISNERKKKFEDEISKSKRDQYVQFSLRGGN